MNEWALSVDFSRAWGEPPCGGIIRRAPADFQVCEELGFEPAGDGEHAWVRIRKTGANTAWVAGRLAELAGVRSFDVGYAGRKDRHAVTEQWFSCYLPGRPDPDWWALSPEEVEVLATTRHTKKLRKGNHRGNRFRIRVAGLTGSLDRLDERLASVAENGFPNYFGEQRFGRQRGNLVQVERLFAGERINRAKRDIYISAARAYLFNRVLSDRVDDASWLDAGPGGRIATGPLFGVRRKPAAGEDRLPDGLEAWCEGLARFKVKAARRPLAVVPEAFEWTFEDGDTLVLSFGLPSGSYATSLLRELIHDEERRESAGHEEV